MTTEIILSLDDMAADVCHEIRVRNLLRDIPQDPTSAWQMLCDGLTPDELPSPDLMLEALRQLTPGTVKINKYGTQWAAWVEGLPDKRGTGRSPSEAIMECLWLVMGLRDR